MEPITRKVIESCPSLKAISAHGVGFDLWENMFLNHFLVIGLVSEVISSYTVQMKIKDNKCTSSNLNLFDF